MVAPAAMAARDRDPSMSGEIPHTVIKPPSRWAPLNVREVWEFRDLLVRFTIRDLKLRYKQTALGVLGCSPAAARRWHLQLRVRAGR